MQLVEADPAHMQAPRDVTYGQPALHAYHTSLNESSQAAAEASSQSPVTAHASPAGADHDHDHDDQQRDTNDQSQPADHGNTDPQQASKAPNIQTVPKPGPGLAPVRPRERNNIVPLPWKKVYDKQT